MARSTSEPKVRNLFKSARKRAKDSLKLLELLESETVKRAQEMVSFSRLKAQTRKTNEKILGSLQRLGVASQAEVVELKARIAELEQALETLKSKE